MKRLLLLALVLTACCPSPPDSSSSCTLIEYDGERQVVFVKAGTDIYSGVDSPGSSVKGSISKDTPGGIEAKCGSYYRLQGVDWWGWVRISDTYK